MNVAFLHLELHLGGAERLVLDAATELVSRGHRVVLLTTRRDRARAFPEAVDGSLDVRVHGRFLPMQIGGRLRAPCAIARMAWLGMALRRLRERPDVVFCDLVAHVVPLVRRVARVPVVFYCHYPDRFLAPPAGGARRWYRRPIDRLEERGTANADRVLVNSRYTARRLREAFPRLAVDPSVVYPGVEPSPCPDLPEEPPPGPLTILAVGRFDPRKQWRLAADAFAALRERMAAPAFARVRLVFAGGYDPSLREHRDTRTMLEERFRALGLTGQVELRFSPSEDERRALLSECRIVLHTPADEHFGFVPVEAMAAGRPVVAVASGGPAETVRDGETGFLCPPTPADFADAMARLLTDHAAAARMGRAGRARVATCFSRAKFGERLEAVLRDVTAARSRI
ncbi:MAG: glycosyltransferase [Candidatus Binatia bacterium]